MREIAVSVPRRVALSVSVLIATVALAVAAYAPPARADVIQHPTTSLPDGDLTEGVDSGATFSVGVTCPLAVAGGTPSCMVTGARVLDGTATNGRDFRL